MKFCKICGTVLELSKNDIRYEDGFEHKDNDSNFYEQSRKKSNKGIVILIVCIVAVLIAIGISVAFLIRGNSSNNNKDNDEIMGIVATETINATQVSESITEEETTKETEQPTTIEMISVPDVVGMNQKDAESKLDKVNLSVIVQDGEDDSTPNGYVISQSPVAGKSIEKGEPVTIYISRKQSVSATASPNSSLPVDNKKYLYCCASDFATLRNRPSRSGSEIVKITTREKVEYLGRDGEFYHVSYKGDKGYVLAEFFSEDINAPLNYGTGNL